MVALYHFPYGYDAHRVPLLRSAWLFVDFFFVLSGFVITHAYLDELAGGGSLRRFALQRAGRLWPLHAAALALFVGTELSRLAIETFTSYRFGVAAFSSEDRTLFSLVTSTLLIHVMGLHGRLVWNQPSWSVAVEFWIYLLFALLVRTARPQRWLALALGAALCALLAVSPQSIETAHDFGLLRGAYGFLTGHFAWRAARALQLRGWDHRLGGAWDTALELLAAGALIGFVAVVIRTPLSFAAPLVFGFAVLVFSQERGRLSELLTTSPLRGLGRLSYSVYLVHAWVLWTMGIASNGIILLGRRFWPEFARDPWLDGSPWLGAGLLAVYIGLVLALAALAHRYVEAPALRRTRQWAARISGGQSSAALVGVKAAHG
jgi:peptidoglycan/LPS O-acetylase OafA/YrhL